MIFEEFKSLALNPPYIDRPCIYRVDIHGYINKQKDAVGGMEYEVKLCKSFMYDDWHTLQRMLHDFIHKEYFNQNLYALYVYQLPINTDLSHNQYQRLWVYDREGNCIDKSMSSTLIEELDTSFAKFRGRDAESIHFNVGDVVEVHDREDGKVRLGVVIKQPPTIEHCWETRKEVEKECRTKGVDVCMTDENYWLYSIHDCYWIAHVPGWRNLSFPHTTDVFYPSHQISDRVRQHFAECYRKTIEDSNALVELSKLIVLSSNVMAYFF